MSGISQIDFAANDIVPIILPSPTDSTVYTVIVDTDVNGYTWSVLNAANSPVSTGSEAYGDLTGQFGA
jgi:hypothetical protein